LSLYCKDQLKQNYCHGVVSAATSFSGMKLGSRCALYGKVVKWLSAVQETSSVDMVNLS
jgi:hypothetical protein